MALTKLQSSMESTRGHLQKELRTKEADCNRMAVQIRVGSSKAHIPMHTINLCCNISHIFLHFLSFFKKIINYHTCKKSNLTQGYGIAKVQLGLLHSIRHVFGILRFPLQHYHLPLSLPLPYKSTSFSAVFCCIFQTYSLAFCQIYLKLGHL